MVFVRIHLRSFLPPCGKLSMIWRVASSIRVDKLEEARAAPILKSVQFYIYTRTHTYIYNIYKDKGIPSSQTKVGKPELIPGLSPQSAGGKCRASRPLRAGLFPALYNLSFSEGCFNN